MQKALFWALYQGISLVARGGERRFMNYGYVPLDGEPPLVSPEDADRRYSAALYLRVAGAVDLRDKDVLEVGCGRGGGAAMVARHLGPRSVVGVDFAYRAIEFCHRHYRIENLSFRQADAEALPFGPESFDAVLNVESSHCYPNVDRFFSGVARVLRPGGYFLFADLRLAAEIPVLRQMLGRSGLTVVEEERITPNVVRALELDSARRRSDVESRIPSFLPFLRAAFYRFVGVEGTAVFDALRRGEAEYWRFVLRKERNPLRSGSLRASTGPEMAAAREGGA